MINHALIDKLNTLESCMADLERVRSKLMRLGYTEQANHADALSEDLNWCHADAFEAEGPIVMKGEK